MTEPAGDRGLSVAQLMYQRAQLEAALSAVKQGLEEAARRRYDEDQAAATWRLYGNQGTLSTRETHDRLEVIDEEVFREHMAERFPHQYRRAWLPVNPAWENKVREQWAEMGGYDEQGQKVPGVALVVGGEYAGTSLWLAGDLKDGLRERAREALAAGRPLIQLGEEPDDVNRTD